MRNHVSKRLKPAPSKNIENWRSFSDLRERSQRKIVIGVFGDSPKMEKVRNLFFSEIERELPYLCFDTTLVYFGSQGAVQCFTNIIYAKIANRLVPPLNANAIDCQNILLHSVIYNLLAKSIRFNLIHKFDTCLL